MELEEAADGVSKLTSKTICKSDHDMDDKTAAVQNSDIKNEEELGKKEHTVDASDTIFKKTTEKEFLMSLDITEYELQMMERQAEEEKRLEAACMPKVNIGNCLLRKMWCLIDQPSVLSPDFGCDITAKKYCMLGLPNDIDKSLEEVSLFQRWRNKLFLLS